MEMTDVQFVAMLLAVPLAVTIDPFAPLLAFSVALRAGWISDPRFTGPEFAGFAQPEFLAVVGFLYVLHAMADKVPPIAHLFDAIGVVAKPLAGAIIGLWLSNKLDPHSALHWYAMAVVILGGVPSAAALQLMRTKVRLGASVGTLGGLHPIVSGIENVVALPLAFLTVIRPELALLIMVLVIVPAIWVCLLIIRQIIRLGVRAGRHVVNAGRAIARPRPPQAGG